MKFGTIERALTAGLTATTLTLVQQLPLRATGLQSRLTANPKINITEKTALPKTPLQLALSPQERERICAEAKSSLTEITSRINDLRQVTIPEAIKEYESAEKKLRQTPKSDANYQQMFNNFTVAALDLNSQQAQFATYIAALPLGVNNVNRACN